MKNYAKSRVLTLAPRKAFALRTAAFMACIGATGLISHRDASAVPGIPLFPNFDLSQPARMDVSPAPAVLQPEQAVLANQVSQLLQFPAFQTPSAPQAQGQASAPVWDGFGALPGGFKAPWSLPEATFDPSFRVSYWTPTGGFKNTADAPWNYGLSAGQIAMGAAIFDSNFAGKGISNSPQVIWDATAAPSLAGAAI